MVRLISEMLVEEHNKGRRVAGWEAEVDPTGQAAISDRGGWPEPSSGEQSDAELNQLRRIVQDLSYVVHGLSHDLREPVRTINSYIELLKRRTSIDNDPNGREYVHFIASAGRRMDALLTGILEYAHLQGTEARVHIPVDMNTILQTAVANLQTKIEEAHATIVHDELPEVPGDFVQLTQLMQNLVSNAIQYRSSAPPQILVKADRAEANWLFSVRDNGVGIEPRYYEQLFIPFKRLHGHEVPGAGLGLTICRSIVERHGGRIWVESTPGQGTTFAFTLPARKEDRS